MTALAGVVFTASPAHAAATYYTWTNGVNVRYNGGNPPACFAYPGPYNCPSIVGQVHSWEPITVHCQKIGEVIGGNPYWLWVMTPKHWGFMSSYYINYPYNRLPDVPDC
ncbi:hypothetical protein ACFQX7_38290 [Luedemannella flava]